MASPGLSVSSNDRSPSSQWWPAILAPIENGECCKLLGMSDMAELCCPVLSPAHVRPFEVLVQEFTDLKTAKAYEKACAEAQLMLSSPPDVSLSKEAEPESSIKALNEQRVAPARKPVWRRLNGRLECRFRPTSSVPVKTRPCNERSIVYRPQCSSVLAFEFLTMECYLLLSCLST